MKKNYYIITSGPHIAMKDGEIPVCSNCKKEMMPEKPVFIFDQSEGKFSILCWDCQQKNIEQWREAK